MALDRSHTYAPNHFITNYLFKPPFPSQESQAIEVGDFNLNTPTNYKFDFLIPVERRLNSDPNLAKTATKTSSGTVLSRQSSKLSDKTSLSELSTTASSQLLEESWSETLSRAPKSLEFYVYLKGFGQLCFYDRNGQGNENYVLNKKLLENRPENSDLGMTQLRMSR